MTPRVYNKHKGAPPDAVYIGRGSPWGNPFVLGKDGDRNGVCDLFAKLVLADPEYQERVKRELKGKNLVCFCKPLRCHGDFLLLLANQEPDVGIPMSGKVSPPPAVKPRVQAWAEEYMTMLTDCENRSHKLSDWECNFVDSLQRQIEIGKRPSPKQVEALDNLWEKATKN
jgi:hypothetical protein